jgi:hypothetical protein
MEEMHENVAQRFASRHSWWIQSPAATKTTSPEHTIMRVLFMELTLL